MSTTQRPDRSWTRRARRLCAVGALLAVVPLVPAGSVSAAEVRVVQEGESIQEAIDKAPEGTEIRIRGHHEENVWIHKDGITLRGLAGASMTLPENPVPNPCGYPVVVCAIPAAAADSFPDFPRPFEYLRDVGVSNLTLNAPNGDAIGVLFTNQVDIRNNVMPEMFCNGIWVFISSGISVVGNEVGSAAVCDAIAVVASSRARILGNSATNSAFAGILTDDVSDVRIHGNTVSGNCIGIVAFDSPGPLLGNDVTITRNVANANNTICFPFEADAPIGATGILGVAVDGLIIKNNTANDNVTDQFSITAGGISVQDSAFDGTLANDVLVTRNTATGNSSAAGPADLSIFTAGNIKAVKKNNCDVSVPNPAWCAD